MTGNEPAATALVDPVEMMARFDTLPACIRAALREANFDFGLGIVPDPLPRNKHSTVAHVIRKMNDTMTGLDCYVSYGPEHPRAPKKAPSRDTLERYGFQLPPRRRHGASNRERRA